MDKSTLLHLCTTDEVFINLLLVTAIVREVGRSLRFH